MYYGEKKEIDDKNREESRLANQSIPQRFSLYEKWQSKNGTRGA